MNVGDPGYHNHTLSAEDIQEAKDSAGSIGKPITRIDCIFSDYKLNCSSDENDSISTLDGTFAEPTRVKLFGIWDWTTPERTNVPQGYGYIARAFRLHVGDSESVNILELDETERSFNKPMRVTISYTDQDIRGGEVECLNISCSPLLESELNAFVYDFSTSRWDVIPGSILDIQRNTITFETYRPGIFGIGGPEKVEEEFEYPVLFEEASVRLIQFPMAPLMIGNERINLYVDGEVKGHLVTENNEVVRIGTEDLEDPTLNVHISEGTLEELVDGEITFVEALEDDKIRFEGVGFSNSLKLAASSVIFTIYSFFSDLM